MRPDMSHPRGEPPRRPEGQQTVLLRSVLGWGGLPRDVALPPHYCPLPGVWQDWNPCGMRWKSSGRRREDELGTG